MCSHHFLDFLQAHFFRNIFFSFAIDLWLIWILHHTLGVWWAFSQEGHSKTSNRVIISWSTFLLLSVIHTNSRTHIDTDNVPFIYRLFHSNNTGNDLGGQTQRFQATRRSRDIPVRYCFENQYQTIINCVSSKSKNYRNKRHRYGAISLCQSHARNLNEIWLKRRINKSVEDSMVVKHGAP